MRTTLIAALALACVLSAAAGAEAQTGPAAQRPNPAGPAKPASHNFELDAGVVWTGSTTFGSRNSTETQPDGSPFILSSTSSRFNGGPGAEAHLGRKLGGSVWIEATGSWSRVKFATTVTADPEGAASAVVTNTTDEFLVGGALVWGFGHGRVEPFLRGGASWLRQVSEGFAVGENGIVGDVGGGVKYWMRNQGRGMPIGLRLEGRATIRSGGFLLGPRTPRIAPAVAATLMIRF